jgi:hypothetical protein
MEIDGHIIELDLDNLEIANSESLDQTIYDKIESNGHIVKRTKKFNTLETSAELEDIIKTFKRASTDYLPKDGMMVVDGKEYEVDLMLNWPIAKLADDTKEYWRIPKTSILYIKSKQGEEIWAIYDR